MSLRMRYLAGGASVSNKGGMGAEKAIRTHAATNRTLLPANSPKGRPGGNRIGGLVCVVVGLGLVLFAALRGHENAPPPPFKPLEELRWGIVGCGDVTEKKSGPALQLIENSRLVMVMRRNLSLAEDYAKRHNVARWTDKAEDVVNDPEVNAIYVATPPRYHALYSLMAAKVGKPVYVEKPMGPSYMVGRQLVDEFAKRGVPLHVAYYRRSVPCFVKVKEIIDQGSIGSPRSVHVEYHRPPNKNDALWAAAGGSRLPPGACLKNASLGWRTDPLVGGEGGYFRDKGSHQLDLLDYWFGPIVSASGRAENVGRLYPTSDTVAANFKFKSGVLGTASWCFVTGESGQSEFAEVTGSAGRIRFHFFKSTQIEVWNDTGHEEIDVPNPKHIQQPLLELVVKSLRGEGEAPSTGVSALRSSAVMDAILSGVPFLNNS
eukprot:TRINITY_DN20625_c0_g1_i1.p1 TRINITY_DN20625_c0_g1~~TRINITY_DN20625_c0_g1_i1.p1  ORF type:complete len:432 (+),score=56.96 TRINITY_DN20625_c0_g1_i1:1054-2349(+)